MPERSGRIASRNGKPQDARTDRVLGTARPSRAASRPGSAESCARSRSSIRIRWPGRESCAGPPDPCPRCDPWLESPESCIASGRDAHRPPTPAATMCYPGKNQAEVVAGLAVPAGIASRSTGIPATIVTAVSRDIASLGRRVVARGACVAVPRLAVALGGLASPAAETARLRRRLTQNDERRSDQQTYLQIARHGGFSHRTMCATAESTTSMCKVKSRSSRACQPNLPHPQNLVSRNKCQSL